MNHEANHDANHHSDPNARLRRAVKNTEVPPFLEARIRNAIRTQEARPSTGWSWGRLVPAGAALALLMGAGLAYQLGHLRLTVASQEGYIASMSNRVATLMRVGLGDHIHCAYFRKYPQTAPSLETLVTTMGDKYASLLPVVRKNVPASYRMVMAHQCKYHNRTFIHVTLMGEENLMSVVITAKGAGESFTTEGMLPALVESGIPMYRGAAQSFQMDAFETQGYLVYFISDLSSQENSTILAAMAPEMQQALASL